MADALWVFYTVDIPLKIPLILSNLSGVVKIFRLAFSIPTGSTCAICPRNVFSTRRKCRRFSRLKTCWKFFLIHFNLLILRQKNLAFRQNKPSVVARAVVCTFKRVDDDGFQIVQRIGPRIRSVVPRRLDSTTRPIIQSRIVGMNGVVGRSSGLKKKKIPQTCYFLFVKLMTMDCLH